MASGSPDVRLGTIDEIVAGVIQRRHLILDTARAPSAGVLLPGPSGVWARWEEMPEDNAQWIGFARGLVAQMPDAYAVVLLTQHNVTHESDAVLCFHVEHESEGAELVTLIPDVGVKRQPKPRLGLLPVRSTQRVMQ
jgi:hypothetical protein